MPRVSDLPYLDNGLLVCPGGYNGSKTWHRCSFVLIDDQWCFHSELMVDDLFISSTPKRLITQTLIEPVVGETKIAVARCRCKNGLHRLEALLHMEWSTKEVATLVPGQIEIQSKKLPELSIKETSYGQTSA